MRLRTRVVVTAVAALSAGLILLVPEAAWADGGNDALVSIDGTHYGTSVASAVFSDDIVITPQTTHSASIYIKNPTANDALFSIRLTDVATSDPRFAESLTLSAHPSGADAAGAAVSLASDERCPALVSSGRLPAGSSVHNVLELAMADVDGAVAQGEQASFALRVTLRDAAAPAAASVCGDGRLVQALAPPGSAAGLPTVLASTGVQVALMAVGGATLIMLGGITMMSRRRERTVVS